MQTINWDDLEEHEVVKGIYGKFFHSESMSVVRWRFDSGASLPMHDHPHEQITIVLEGELQLTVGSQEMHLKAGDVSPVSPNVPHGGKALVNSVVLDIFHPVRDDFKKKFG